MTYTVAVCTVKNSWWWTEELSETCRVLFQNKFEKIVHLVGFIIWIYHDARSPERQIKDQYTFLIISLSILLRMTVWHIPLLCVQWKTPDDGQGNCPKCVEFYSKNKFEKLMHLVGFIVWIYHDARSPERQIKDQYTFLIISRLVLLRKRNVSYIRCTEKQNTYFYVQ